MGETKNTTMRTFDVTITATVTKTVRVSAENDKEACEKAHEEFDVSVTGPDVQERYTEVTDSCVEVTE
jgi:fibronectin type 3 domain-containing protein